MTLDPPTTTDPPLRIVYLTAGAAGMICGSCLHDNTLARALLRLGHDVQLLPFYTPIRTDEEDVTAHSVFFGGINVYLQQNAPVFRWLPRWLDRWLDSPRLIQWASGRSIKIAPTEVADLAISVLKGHEGNLRKEVDRLIDWLSAGPPPDIVVLSNILTAGFIPELKRRLNVPVAVTLQGDDIFLRGLPPSHEAQALRLIRDLGASIDLFIVHSRFYAEAMSAYLGLDAQKMRIVPLGIDTADFKSPGDAQLATNGPPTMGYLARLTPEKGLAVLADAFIRLKALPGMADARLRVAGWLGESHKPFVEQVFSRIGAAGHAASLDFLGEVDRRAKLEFLKSLHVLSVPTTYHDPKGLFALEAMAAGVPVVLPNHGAFPELIQDTGGGLLHAPANAEDLAQRLHELMINHDARQALANSGRNNVHSRRNERVMAEHTLAALRAAIASAR